jgi:hypothetical protein
MTAQAGRKQSFCPTNPLIEGELIEGSLGDIKSDVIERRVYFGNRIAVQIEKKRIAGGDRRGRLMFAVYPHVHRYRPKLDVEQVRILGRHISRSTKRRVRFSSG